MNSFIASSVKRDLAADAARSSYLGAGPNVQDYASGILRAGKARQHKGLFIQDKTAKPGTARDKIPRQTAAIGRNRSERAGASSPWHTSSPRAASSANTPTAS